MDEARWQVGNNWSDARFLFKTSGLSLADEVREAQKLGAGQYIKKPITLEKIGLAIKEELEK